MRNFDSTADFYQTIFIIKFAGIRTRDLTNVERALYHWALTRRFTATSSPGGTHYVRMTYISYIGASQTCARRHTALVQSRGSLTVVMLLVMSRVAWLAACLTHILSLCMDLLDSEYYCQPKSVPLTLPPFSAYISQPFCSSSFIFCMLYFKSSLAYLVVLFFYSYNFYRRSQLC